MKKLTCTALVSFLLSAAYAQYSYQDLNSQLVNKGIRAITVDNNANTIITGNFLTTLTLGSTTLTNSNPSTSGSNAAFIAKMASDGSFTWAKNIVMNKPSKKNGCATEYSQATIDEVSTDAGGNIYITGFFSGSITLGSTTLVSQNAGGSCGAYTADIFTAKISAAGAFLWAKAEGSAVEFGGEEGYSVVADAAGSVYVTGRFSQSLIRTGSGCNFVGVTQNYIYIVKYNSSGTKVWEKKLANNIYSCTDNISGFSIRTDGTNLFVSGVFFGTVNFGNNISLTAANASSFLMKLDTNGNTSWVKSAVTNNGSSAYPNFLLLDNNNTDVYIGGSFYGNAAFGATVLSSASQGRFLAKYSASTGNLAWAVNAGASGTARIFKHPDGNIGINAADSGVSFTLKEFSTADGSLAGTTTATNIINGNGNVTLLGIATATNGFVYSQNLKGSYDFGGTTISSTQQTGSSYSDLMLVKYTIAPLFASRSTGSFAKTAATNMALYPNPSTDQITVRNGNNKMLGNVSVCDVSGRIVFHKFIAEPQTIIPLQQLSAGIYYLKSDQTGNTIKFVKQ